jgi:hypothetical protein
MKQSYGTPARTYLFARGRNRNRNKKEKKKKKKKKARRFPM